MKTVNLSDVFPILKIEDNFIISKNGDYSVCLELILPEIYTITEEQLVSLSNSWTNAIQALPDNSILHKQDWFTYEDLNYTTSESIFGKKGLITKSIDIENFSKKVQNHKVFLYITKTKGKSRNKNSMTSFLSRGGIVSSELLNKDLLAQFIESIKRFTAILKGTEQIKIRQLKTDEIKSADIGPGLLESYFCLNFNHAASNEIHFDKDLQIGNNYCRMYSLSDLQNIPDHVANGVVDDFHSTDKTKLFRTFIYPLCFDIKANHIVNQVIFIDEHAAFMKDLENNNKTLRATFFLSKDNEVSYNENNNFLDYLITTGSKSCRVHLNVLAWTNEREKIPTLDETCITAFSKIGANPSIVGAHSIGNLFMGCCPGNAGDIPHEETFFSIIKHAVCFINFETSYKSSSNGILFNDRSDDCSPFVLDMFDEPYRRQITDNRNRIIIGPSGTGKSFTINHILRQEVEQGYHVVMLDIGNSYKKLCTLFQEEYGIGKYYIYDDKNPLQFNPFKLFNDELTEDKIQFLISLIYTLWKKPATSEISQILSNAIIAYYNFLYKENGGDPSFTSFYDFFEKDYYPKLSDSIKRYFDIDSFLLVLEPYAYGKFKDLFNAKESIKLIDEPFIVFELDNIKDHPDLFPIVTIIIIETIMDKIRNLPSKRKLIYIDEGWKAIANEGMQEFIKYLYKTIRKHTGGVAIITQNIEDISETPVGASLIGSSDTYILLSHQKKVENISSLQKALSITDNELTKLLSIQNNLSKGYTEVFIRLGSLSKVIRLKATPEAIAVYTSNSNENKEIYELAQKTTLKTAVQSYSQKFKKL